VLLQLSLAFQGLRYESANNWSLPSALDLEFYTYQDNLFIQHIHPELGATDYSLPVGSTAECVVIEDLLCSRHNHECAKKASEG
jgi:hypothetical protein